MRLAAAAVLLFSALLFSAADLSAQSRAAMMTVSVTVVRSAVSGTSEGVVNANGDLVDANGEKVLPAGTAAEPRPATPRESEAAALVITPSSTEVSTSVRIHTINY